MAGTASVYIDDYIEPGRITDALIRERLMAQYPFDSIDCTITSGGGDYFEGFDIYNTLRGFGVPVTTRIPDFCASIATVIFLAGDIRVVAPGPKRGLIHNPWMEVSGDYYQITQHNEDLKRVMDELIAFYAKNTRLDKITLDTLLRVDTELSGEQMVQMGFATGLYNPAAQPAPTQARRIMARASFKPRPTNPTNPTNSIMSNVMSGLLAAIKAIRASTPDVPVKNLDLTLADGSTITTNSAGDTPVIGDSVTVTATGAVPEDGNYTVTDAMGIELILTVAAGMVIDVQPGAVALAPDPVAVVENPELTALKEANAALTQRLAEVEATQSAFQNRVNVVMAHVEKVLGKESPSVNIQAVVNDLKSPITTPAGEPDPMDKVIQEQIARGKKQA